MVPKNVTYAVDELRHFVEKDPEPYIAFYGGEPLLRTRLMKEIMDTVPAKAFMLQTNAIRLKQLEPEYVKRLHTILVSVDGRRTTTDYYRGVGTYDKVIENIKWVRDTGFPGDLVARMAVSEHSVIFEEVSHLLDIIYKDRRLFDNVHWQLDVFWSGEEWNDLDGWINKRYNPGITRLIERWVGRMQQGDGVEGIVPFKAIMGALLTGRKVRMWCGAGRDAFSIMPDGRILCCPICPEFEFANVGELRTSSPNAIRNLMDVEDPCLECDILDICGGRCLFANKARLWGEEGYKKVCGTVRHLITELRRVKPTVEDLIKKGTVDKKAFAYPEVNNGCEIIP